MSEIKPHHIHNFNQIWKLFDKKAIGLINARHLPVFLNELDPPLGWKNIDI